jgi:hypothetical protein
MKPSRILFLVLVGISLSLSSTVAQQAKKDDKKAAKKDDKKQPKKANVFTDAKEAGPDFLIQGEYDGKGIGAQVVAKGNGKFEVYVLTGGLPGAGWDTKGRLKVDGKTEGGKVVFGTAPKTSGSITDGTMTLLTGDATHMLKRVERKSKTIGLQPPAGAIILFDGMNANEWQNGKVVENNLLMCGTSSKKKLAAGTLHIEFRTPFQPTAGGQGRGNSGVYIQNKEIQVLDSFGLTGASNECGAFYGQAKPAVNMCFPPLSWQTYDVDIKADDKGNTIATVLHNGVKVHDNYIINKKAPSPMTINLQNHGNPVMYRNIWFVEAK